MGKLSDVLGESVLAVPFVVSRLTCEGEQGSFHQKQRPCFAASWWADSSGLGRAASVGESPEFELLEVPLAGVLSKDGSFCHCVCTNMDLRYWRPSGRGENDQALVVLGQVFCGLVGVEVFTKHAKRAATGTLLKDRDTLARVVGQLESYNFALFDDAANVAIDEVLGRIKAALAQADALARGIGGRLRTLAKVRVALVGKAAAGSYTFDETPMLVGLKGWRRGRMNALVAELVALFAINSGDDVVLAVPQYVLTYLASVPKSLRSGLVPGVVVREDDSEAVVETALALWDPHGSGELVALAAALGTARMLAYQA